MVVGNIRIKLIENWKEKVKKKIDVQRLKNIEVKRQYERKVTEQMEALENPVEWESVKEILKNAAEEVVGQHRKRKRKKWMKEHIMDLIDNRNKMR